MRFDFETITNNLKDYEPEMQILSSSRVGRVSVVARALTGEYPEGPHLVFKAHKAGEEEPIETESLKEALYHLGIYEPEDT